LGGKSTCWIIGLGFTESKMIDEILEHGQVLNREVFELHAAASHTDLLPRAWRHLMIVHNSALNTVHLKGTIVPAEYFYFVALFIILVCGQILDAQPAYADILDLPHVNDVIGSYESSECPFLAIEPLEFSFFFVHFFLAQASKKGIP